MPTCSQRTYCKVYICCWKKYTNEVKQSSQPGYPANQVQAVPLTDIWLVMKYCTTMMTWWLHGNSEAKVKFSKNHFKIKVKTFRTVKVVNDTNICLAFHYYSNKTRQNL